MIKRISIIVCLLVIFASLDIAQAAAPAATKARSNTASQGIEVIQGLGDVSSGNSVEITSTGALAVTNIAREVTAQLGDGQIYTGACFVQGILISGVSAGDSVAIYDATSATGTAKFDPKIDTADGSFYVDAKGSYFATGIYADATDTEVHVSVTYDY